jgi:hypothetical protein
MATLDSQIRMVPDVLDQEVQGESVLLHLGSESYFGLNPVGTLVWQRLRAGMALRRIHALMLDEYAVDSVRLETDLLDLVDALHGSGLIEILPAGGARAA